MTKQEAVFKRVEAARQKDPATPITALFKKLKVDPNLYYRGRRMAGAHSAKVKRKAAAAKAPRDYRKLKVLSVPNSTATDRLLLVVGTPDQVRDLIAGALQ
jgi:hypothetical protein